MVSVRIFYDFSLCCCFFHLFLSDFMFCFNCVAIFLSEISPLENVEWGKQGAVVEEAAPTTMGASEQSRVVLAADSIKGLASKLLKSKVPKASLPEA